MAALGIHKFVPGAIMPRSSSALNGTRGASRVVMNGASGIGSIAAMRARAFGIFLVALEAEPPVQARKTSEHGAGGCNIGIATTVRPHRVGAYG
jgi:hypothetical protein